jgi:broad specificity phosphatase PhoE
MIKKEKVYELKIEEDDDISGIDSISLVDQPAIEVNWVAFAKEKLQEFHIPDGEDDNYLQQLEPYGQAEDDLLAEGFEVDRIEYNTKEDFTYSHPNAKSEIDTDNFRFRYKYVLNPNAFGSPVIPTTRNFCKSLISKNLVFRLEDMLEQRNDFGQSFADWRGGYNCRHIFAKIVYKKKGYIPNDAKGKETIGYDILGDSQNDTRTKHPSFSKHKDMKNPCEPGYIAYGTKMKDGREVPNCVPIRKQKMEDGHSDYPDTIKHNARRVLDWVEKNGWGSCGTEVGKQRANQLAKGEPLSKDTIKRMYSYLSRHKVDLDSSKGYGDGCGKLMYDAWGGASALSWAESKVKQFEKEEMSGKVLPISIANTSLFEHGQDENNVNGKEGGIKDSNLTENGVKYAKTIGKHLSETGVKRVISSGVKRAKDTADVAKNAANEENGGKNKLVHYINHILNTWNIGKFDGDDIDMFDEDFYVHNPEEVVPDGVSFNHFINQMVKCYSYAKNLPSTDAIITHSKVIRALNALHKTNGEWNDETTQHFLENKKKDRGDYNFGGKVSFDYDGTLDTAEGRLKAKELIKNGYDVYIVTGRNKGESGPVYRTADQLGIPHSKVHFTSGRPKSDVLKTLGIHKHYDNNPDVIKEIKDNAPGIDAEQFDYNVGSIGGYVDPGIGKKKIKHSQEFDYLFTSQETKQYFAQDVDKQIVLGPAMIPNEKIFRRDNQGNPYYVYFSPDTIKMIADKYMKNKYTDNNDMMHDGKAVPDVFVIESWIKESNNDKSTDYGFEKLPVGTWFVSMKINNPEIWKMVKNHELNGFSVSGFFEEVAEFKREELFLLEVAKILKDVRD